MILNETQQAIRDAVRAFAQERIKPRSAAFEAARGYPRELFEQLAGLGVMGMTAPEEVGGAGADYVSYALTLMEIAAADGALSTIISIQNSLIVTSLLKDGTPAQQQRFLPELIAGRMLGAFALTETDAGSDASAIRTRAVKVDGGYRLSGSKQFITSAQIAGIAIVYAVTDPAAGKRGISGFIVPTDAPGYRVDKVEHKLGQNASDTCAIRFDDVFVEENLRLGAEGAGYGIALSNLEAGRIGIASQCIGMAQAALEIAVAYARERKSFGKPIIEHQAVGFRLADLAARLEAARQLVLHAAATKDAGLPSLKEASMAKLIASETAEAVVSGAIQTLGGYGYLEEFGVAKIYRDVRVCQIYEGTSDIQRMVIARAL
ncbi:MAG TPA: acyl-CoA dehydrogenase family protein [Solimonas sp.]